MFGIVRPCAHRLAGGLKAEWTAHLCGLCPALRADHGQLARVVTNYDGLIVSVLTDAQAPRDPARRRTAGPCPLRGMRTASVARGEGARPAATVSLVLASAKVRDHVADGDGVLRRRPLAAAARRVATGWDRAGARTGLELGFDTAVLSDAVDRQESVERSAGPGTPLLTVTEPTETSIGRAFATTGCGHARHRAPGTDGTHGTDEDTERPPGTWGDDGKWTPDSDRGRPPQGPRGRSAGRGLSAGCLVFGGLCCTCRMCCSDTYEGPWSGERREGCCRNLDCSDCCEGCCEGCDCCSHCADGDGCCCDCGGV